MDVWAPPATWRCVRAGCAQLVALEPNGELNRTGGSGRGWLAPQGEDLAKRGRPL